MTWLRHGLVWSLLAAVAYLAIGALAAPEVRFSSDSYRYTVAAYGFLGVDPAVAHGRAVAAYCEAEANRTVRADLLRPDRRDKLADAPLGSRRSECLVENRASVPPHDPRYEAIFAPRVGYPLLATPFLALLGPSGMWAASALCAAAAGLLVFALLRTLGATVPVAAAGQAVLYLSPAGEWGWWALADGPALLAATAVVAGACWVVDRWPSGWPLLMAGLLSGVAVKYSTGLVVAACVAVAALLLGVFGTRRAWLVAAATAAAAAGAALLQHQFGWPGADTTLQDAFTRHFVDPDVPDPWALWATQSVQFWAQWLPGNLVLIAGVVVAAWGAGRLAPLVLATAAAGLALQAAHPLASQADRLYSLAWLAVAVGVPLAAHRLRYRADVPDRRVPVSSAGPGRRP